MDVWDGVTDVTGGEPGELTARAAEATPDVTPLGTPGIEHEWFVGPGEEFLDRFGRRFRETIRGSGGPYEQFESGLIGRERLPTVIVTTLLARGSRAAHSGCRWPPTSCSAR
jgi:hypothetical protein